MPEGLADRNRSRSPNVTSGRGRIIRRIHQMGLIDQTERYSLSNVGKAWLPQLSVSGKASYQSDVTKLPLDGDKISSLLPGFEIPSLSKDQYQVVAQVDQTIWDGGSTRSARALTRAEAIANRGAIGK